MNIETIWEHARKDTGKSEKTKHKSGNGTSSYHGRSIATTVYRQRPGKARKHLGGV